MARDRHRKGSRYNDRRSKGKETDKRRGTRRYSFSSEGLDYEREKRSKSRNSREKKGKDVAEEENVYVRYLFGFRIRGGARYVRF